MRFVIAPLFLLLLSVLLASCAPEAQEAPPLPAPGPDDNLLMEAFHTEYQYSDNGRVTARLQTKHVQERNEAKEAQASSEIVRYMDGGVKIEFYTAAGTVESTITSHRAIYREREATAELKGDVVVVNATGEVLETEQLFWDRKADKIYNDIFVRITTPDKIITGDHGMTSDTKFTHYEVKGVRGTVDDNGF